MELAVGNGTVEMLWVRIKGQTDKADFVVGVCCRPPRQDGNTDKLFYKELSGISRSAALVLMGDFNFPDISWENHTANTNRSRKFLRHVNDSFLVQILRELTRKGVVLDLLLVNREGLVGAVVISGHPGHRSHEVIEFKIFGNR